MSKTQYAVDGKIKDASYTQPAVKIRVFINGDASFRGQILFVSPKKMSSLEVLLDNITRILRPNFGAVRSLYVPYSRRKIKVINRVLQAVK